MCLCVYFFILFYLFCNAVCIAQKQPGQLQVSYQMYLNGDWPITFPGVLYINKGVTIYQGKLTLKKDWDNGKPKEEIIRPQSKFPEMDDYLKIDYNTREILFFDIPPGGNNQLLTDNFPVMKWEISTQSKSIAGHVCTKATTTYRGRGWTVWFASDIAAPYGPWKLNGLPGLILEATDEQQMLSMTAFKIEELNSHIFDTDFTRLRKPRNTAPTQYRQFLIDRDEAMHNMMDELSNNVPGMTVKFNDLPRSGLELKYEWEQ